MCGADQTLSTIENDSEDVAAYFAGVTVFVSRLTSEACERKGQTEMTKKEPLEISPSQVAGNCCKCGSTFWKGTLENYIELAVEYMQ